MQKVDVYVKSIKCLRVTISGGWIPYDRTILLNYPFILVLKEFRFSRVKYFMFWITVLIELYKKIFIYIDLFLFLVIDKSVRR